MNIFHVWTLIYQFRVIRHVFNRIFGVLKSDKTPGPLRNLSSSLLDRDIIIRCRNFCVKESGNSFPFTFANRSNISFASPNRPFANNHLGDSGKNLKRSYAFYNNAHSANKGIGKEKGVSYSIYDVTIITHHQYRIYKRNGALVTTANVLQSLIKYVTPANMHNPIV